MLARTMIGLSGIALALVTATASAASYNVNWMQMAPTPFGNAPPAVGTYNLPGIGSVQMAYSLHPDFVEARLAVGPLAVGSVTSGGDTYAWTSQECLARTNWAYSGVVNSSWFVTYTFSGTVPAGKLVVGVQGLGRRDPNPGETAFDCMTTVSCLQNGTHLGDFTGSMNVGATQFTDNTGSFDMINSLTGAGGYDPWWNTGLAVVMIDDAVSSITLRVSHTGGDGIGVNIGSVEVPAPGAAALAGLGALVAVRRRR